VSELETRLERHILRQLLLRWRRINDECLGGRLTPPVFVLDEARQRLGRWEGNTRTLGISRDHIRSSNWLQIEQTLRHEMAHQAVSELFDASAAKPHGILFRRACRMLEVAPGEVGTSAYDPNTNRVLRRIQKLMQLATSANENEAQSAMNTANKLLLMHNLELQETQEEASFVYRWIGKASARISLERKLIGRILSDHFFVQCIWVNTTIALSKKQVRMLEIMGQPHNVELAEYVHDYLQRTVDSLWKNYQKQVPQAQQYRESGREYRAGVLMGFDEQLDLQKGMCQEQGLIWTGDPALREFLSQRYPSRRNMGTSRYREGQAHKAGRTEGQKMRIPGALGGGSSDSTVRGLLN